MSMSIETVLENYRAKMSRLSSIVKRSIEEIKKMLEDALKINGGKDDCVAQIQKLLEPILQMDQDIENNVLLKDILEKKHIPVEEAKIINGRLNKYAREIAEINIKALNLKEEVIKNAFEDKIKAMDEKSFDINKVEDDLIANFSENKTKNIVKDFFNKNRHNLLNKEKAEIKNLVFDLFKKENNNTNIYLSSSLEEISEEKEVYNNVIDNFKKLQISKNTLSKEQFNEKQIEFETKKIFTQVDEAARRDSIRKIIASIKERGFIVNPNNIRHIKENGEDKVILFSQKVTGEEAIFTVYLDGRFNYKFEGYEGHDHDIDSEPFLERLTMYDVSLSTEQKKVYFNPDRIKKAAKMGHKPNSNKNNQ